jgi:beta-mannosidase
MLPLLLPRNENTLTFVAGPSSTCNEVDGAVKVEFVSIETGKVMRVLRVHEIRIAANGTTVIPPGDWVETFKEPSNQQRPDEPFDVAKQDPLVIHASLYPGCERFCGVSADGKLVAEDVAWPDPIKYLSLKGRSVSVRCFKTRPSQVFVSAYKPVKGFVFEEREGVQFSDNGFDIVPRGRTETVTFTGCKVSKLKWRYVGMEVREELRWVYR